MRSKTVNDQHEPPEPPETKDNTEATKKFLLQSLENLEETASNLDQYKARLDEHRESLQTSLQKLDGGSRWDLVIYLAVGMSIGWVVGSLILWIRS